MKSASKCREVQQNHFLIKKDRFHSLVNTASLFFYLSTLTLTILFCSHLLYHPTNTKYTANIQIQEYTQTNHTFAQPKIDIKNCDLFKGHWIRDERGSLYTNHSCTTIPFLRNCFLHGRKDTDFLHWRWKPEECQLPRFSPGTFLTTLQGKTMAFIGDSLARNQMESLLCLLSTVSTSLTSKDA